MKLIFKTLVITFLAITPPLGFASTVKGLYSATIEVPDQSRAQRQKGLSLALAQVLVKTTGEKGISSRPGVNDALSQASNYMVKYAYLPRVEHENKEGDEWPAEPGIPLSVQFAKATIDDLMRKLDLPIWPANRPELLIWVLEQTTSGYRFVEGSDLPAELQQSFQRRGLPIQWPLYDLQDHLALNPLDAWSLSEQKLSDAKRYGSDHWLVLRYSKISSGAIRGSWYLAARSGNFAGEKAVLNTLQIESKSAYLQSSADQVVDLYAGKMAYFADAEAHLFRLVVENIGSFSAYSQLNDFLSRLQIVNGVKVRSIEGDTIVLDLATEGESRVLLRALNKEPRLSRITQLGDASPEQPLAGAARHSGSVEHFRWQAAR